MESLLKSILEILFFFSLGYLVVKVKMFPPDYSKAYTDFIVKIGFPALVFYNIYHLKVSPDLFVILLIGYTSIVFSILVSFVVGRILSFDKKTFSSFVLLSSFGNTGFLGYPFSLSLYGEEALRYAVLFDNIGMFLPFYLIAPLIISYGKGEKFNIDIKRFFFFPPTLAFILAIFLKPFSIPSTILELSDVLGKTVIPLILFSVGMNMRLSYLKERFRDVLSVVFIKNLLTPVFLLIVLVLLDVSMELPIKVSILQAAMPPMILASIFIINAELDRELAVSSVATGILFSFVSVPTVYFLVGFCAKL